MCRVPFLHFFIIEFDKKRCKEINCKVSFHQELLLQNQLERIKMSSVYARPGASAAPKKSEKESIYSKIVNNPSFPIVFNLGLFAVC